jgi:hypothetical protein
VGYECCKLYPLIYDPDGKCGFSSSPLGCSTRLPSLVLSLGYFMSNRRQVLLGGHQIRRFCHMGYRPILPKGVFMVVLGFVCTR